MASSHDLERPVLLIDSANPRLAGLEGATASYVDLFYALAEVR